MTPNQEFVLSILVSILTITITPLIVAYINRRKTTSEINVDYAAAAKTLVEGSSDAVEVVTRLLERYEEGDKIKTARINELEARLTSIQLDEGQRTAKMQRRIDALTRRMEYLEQTLKESSIPFEPRPDDLMDTGERLKKANS
jgi:uncharacterized coiled-coil protein SlyX